MSKTVNLSTKTRAKFLKREAAVARELVASLDNVEECDCDHCETRVLKRALDAYLQQLTADSTRGPGPSTVM